MRKRTFAYINAQNEVADQMRGTCNCAADQGLCLRYRDNTSVSDPEDSFFFRNAAQECLSVCNQCVGMGKLGWVKAIHRLKCNHAG